METLTFNYLYPVNKKNLICIAVYPIVEDLQVTISINSNVQVNYYLHRPAEYFTLPSSNSLKIAHQVVDVLNSIKGYSRREEVKYPKSWELTNQDYSCVLRNLGSKAVSFQEFNKNHVLSNILANPSFLYKLVKTMKFYLRKKQYGPLVIGIHGVKGTGKTTLAKAIVEGLKYKPNIAHRGAIYHFADPLKNAASSLLGVPVKALECLKNKNEGIPGSPLTYRQFLQILGTEFMQSINEDWAIELAGNYLEEVREHVDVIVIPDVRFEHEFQFIREKCNGVLIKLTREGHTVKDDHASEKPILNQMFNTVVKVATKNDTIVVANSVINTHT